MNRILLVAPGAVPPWTEGRKNFVRDLARTLSASGREVEVVDGAPRGTTGLANRLHAPVRAWSTLRARLQQDACSVALFPYGRFTGAIGATNRMFLSAARRACIFARVPYVTVFYSAAGLELDALGSYAPALAVAREASSVGAIPLGIEHASRAWPEVAHPRRALYICGYQEPKPSVLESILKERGLRDLLEAGTALAALGLTLTIAIPLLRDQAMRDRLAAEASRLCPALKVQFDGATAPLDALCSHDLFLFPYRAEHAVFVPTSLLEAFSIGIPVVAADHAMYATLARGGGEERCALHRAGDSTEIARVVSNVISTFDLAVARASRTRAWVRENWTLQRSASTLVDALEHARAA